MRERHCFGDGILNCLCCTNFSDFEARYKRYKRFIDDCEMPAARDSDNDNLSFFTMNSLSDIAFKTMKNFGLKTPRTDKVLERYIEKPASILTKQSDDAKQDAVDADCLVRMLKSIRRLAQPDSIVPRSFLKPLFFEPLIHQFEQSATAGTGFATVQNVLTAKLLMYSYKAFLWINNEPNQMDLHALVLRYARDVSASMACRRTLGPVAIQSGSVRLGSLSNWLDWVGTIIHMYHALRHFGIMEEDPVIFEALRNLLEECVFQGKRPTKNFENRLFIFWVRIFITDAGY